MDVLDRSRVGQEESRRPEAVREVVASGLQLRREAAANVVAVLKGGMARSIVNRRWLPAA